MFNTRIVRILGSDGGLLVVVNQQNDDDEASAQALFDPDVPVVVIASRTLSSLQRLGAASPVAESRLLFEPDANLKAPNPLFKAAEAKLRSAEILLEQQATAGVMDLLASSMLTNTAALAGLSQVPATDTAVLWLYSEVLPQQLLNQEQVTAIVRALSLSQTPAVPIKLIEQALADAMRIPKWRGNIQADHEKCACRADRRRH